MQSITLRKTAKEIRKYCQSSFTALLAAGTDKQGIHFYHGVSVILLISVLLTDLFSLKDSTDVSEEANCGVSSMRSADSEWSFEYFGRWFNRHYNFEVDSASVTLSVERLGTSM